MINSSGTTTFGYDPLGRRILKTNSGGTTQYFYDDGQVIEEYNESGVLIRKYIYGPSIDEPLMMDDGANKYFYHFDGLGSVSEVTDMNGLIQERYAYDEYGNFIIKDSSGNTVPESMIGNPYTFTARDYDNETGLYYYRARYYSPTLGRFLSPDPIGFWSGDLNLYRYVGNNPVNLVDPLGLLAAGISLEISTINPFTSGGGGILYGINLEYTSSSGLHLYTYNTPNDAGSVGFAPGISLTGNIATGTGDWTGPFESGTGSYGPFTGGYFHTPFDQPDPGYFGLTLGGAFPPGFGLGFTKTEYHQMFPEPTPCK